MATDRLDQLFSSAFSEGGSSPASVDDRISQAFPADTAPAQAPSRFNPPQSAVRDTRGVVDRITSDYGTLIDEAADRYGLDRRLLKGLVRTESAGRPDAKSKVGALGLGQVMPGTARELGYAPEDMLDPAKNIDASARYLAKMLDMSGGDTNLALRKYNAGPYANLDRVRNQGYADSVLKNAMRYNAEGQSDLGRGYAAGLAGTAADWYAESARKNLRGKNYDQAAADLMESQQGRKFIEDESRTQDQLSNIKLRGVLSGGEGLGELADWAQYNIGQTAGSSLPAVGYAAPGALIGGMVAGPLGAVLGGLAGGVYGLGHQYAGNTLSEAVDTKLGHAPTSLEEARAALQQLSPQELDRIESTGYVRGAVEGLADAALGGLAKIVPLGPAADLLSTPFRRSIAAGTTEGAQEVIDNRLGQYGATGKAGGALDVGDLDAFAAGFVGGHGASTIGNLPGAVAQTRGAFDPSRQPSYDAYYKAELAKGNPSPLTRQQYTQQFYDNGQLRDATRAAVQQVPIPTTLPAGAMPAMRAPAAQSPGASGAPAAPEPLPTVSELYRRMLADWKAKAPKPVSQDDLAAEVDTWVAENPDAGELPAHLENLQTYRKWRKTTDKQTQGAEPTMKDALAERKRLVEEQAAAPQEEMAAPAGLEASQEEMAAPAGLEAPADLEPPRWAAPEIPEQEIQDQTDAAYGQLAAQKEADYTRLQAQQPGIDYERDVASAEGLPDSYEARPDLNLRGERPATGMKRRPSEVLAEANAPAVAAQRANTLGTLFEQAKDEARTAKVQELRDQGALIEDADELQWSPEAGWSLYPKNAGRGRRAKDGTFYAEIRNEAGDLIGKVKRKVQEPPDAENTAVQNPPDVEGREGIPEATQAPRRGRARRVPEAQPPAVYAPQGQEVAIAPQAEVAIAPQAEVAGVESGINKWKAAAERAKAKRAKLDPELEAIAQGAEEAGDTDLGDDLSGTEYGELFKASSTEYSRRVKPAKVSTPERLRAVANTLSGSAVSPKLQIHKTLADAEKAVGRKLDPNAQGFVTNGQAHFIADHIAEGTETGVMLHEVGAHLGMAKMVPRPQQEHLAGQVNTWAKSGSGVAKDAAQAALRRAGGNPGETLAYFVEEAVNRGINPTAMDAKSPLGQWFQKLWSAFKSALRRFGIQKLDNLSPQEIVNLAYGAAQLELKSSAPATPSATDDIRYSRFDDFLKSSEPFLQSAPVEGLAEGMSELVVQLNGIPQLAKWRPDLNSLQTIRTAEQGMQAAYDDYAGKTMERVDAIRKMPKAVQRNLHNLMIDSTVDRIHPNVGLDHELNQHLDDTPETRAKHEKLRQAYNNLPRDARDEYGRVRDLFQEMFDARKDALVNLAEKLSGKPEAERIKAALNALSRQSPGPYFPLMRFGNFIATWKSQALVEAERNRDAKQTAVLQSDPEHYKVSFFDRRGQAQRQVDQWIREGGDATDLDGSNVKERMDYLRSTGVNESLQPLLAKMKESLDVTLGAGNSTEAKEAITQVFLAALPDNSIFRSAMRRRNVAGVKPVEMLRAIAQHGSSQAFHVSRLQHSYDVQSGLSELRKEDTRAMQWGEKTSVFGAVARALSGLYAAEAHGAGGRFAGGLMSAVYYTRLALNPAFWISSAMTPASVSIPYMVDRHKISSAYREWGKAVGEAASIIKPALAPGKGLQDNFLAFTTYSISKDIDGSSLPKDEKGMLRQLMQAGGLDQTEIRELTSIARDGVGVLDDTKRFLGRMAHFAESLSRMSTALTAYRLEKAKTGDVQKATDYAIEVVDSTLFNYTYAHTPLILRKNGLLGSPTAKLIFQFARYQVGMGQLMWHTIREARDQNASAESRAAAQKKLLALGLVNAGISGAGGVYGLSALSALAQLAANMLYEDDDEPDIEQKARQLVDEIVGGDKTLSVMVRRGVPAAFGLDLSGRMGMQDMLNLRRSNPFRGDKEEMLKGMTESVPALSHLIDWVAWMKNPSLKSFPVSLVSNFDKALELNEAGMLNRQGIVKKGPEDYDFADILLQGLGFPPTESTEAYANQEYMRKTDKAILSRKQELLNTWNKAMNAKDQEAIADARREIQSFNDRHKGQRDVVITPATLTKSRKQRLEREGRMNEYGVYIPKNGAWRQQYFTTEEP